MREEGNPSELHVSPASSGIDLRALLRPSEWFSSPEEVLENELLDIDEKRAILAGWASDLCAVESVPGLRELPGSHALVAVSDILAALKRLDGLDTAIPGKRSWLPLSRGRKRCKHDGNISSASDAGRLQKNCSGPLELRS